MLGRVTLQLIKAKRVLKSLVSLETKFQEKPWAPKYHISSFWAVPLPFSAHPKGPRGTESPEVPRSARSGTAWHVPRADLSLLLTVARTCNEYQETQTGEHQVKPLRTHRALYFSKSVQRVKGTGLRTRVKVKHNTTASGWGRLFLKCDQLNEYIVKYYFLLCLGISSATFTKVFQSLIGSLK